MSDRTTWVVTDQDSVVMTATTNGTAHLVERYAECTAVIDVTAVSGTTPTLNIALKVGADNSKFATSASFTEITATGTYIKTISGNIGQYMRPVYTIAGTTPSFTFTMKLVFKT